MNRWIACFFLVICSTAHPYFFDDCEECDDDEVGYFLSEKLEKKIHPILSYVKGMRNHLLFGYTSTEITGKLSNRFRFNDSSKLTFFHIDKWHEIDTDRALSWDGSSSIIAPPGIVWTQFDEFSLNRKTDKNNHRYPFVEIGGLQKLFHQLDRDMHFGIDSVPLTKVEIEGQKKIHKISENIASCQRASLNKDPEDVTDYSEEIARLQLELKQEETRVKKAREKREAEPGRRRLVLQNLKKYIDEKQGEMLHEIKVCLDDCLKYHDNPSSYFDLSVFYFSEGDCMRAIEAIQTLSEKIDIESLEAKLASEIYQAQGEAESEVGLYEQAIVSLGLALQKDPSNKNLYLERAINYFEAGKFDEAIADYLEAGKPRKTPELSSQQVMEFSAGLCLGLAKGGGQAVVEFVPGVLSLVTGLSHFTWELATHPVDTSKDLVHTTMEIAQFLQSNDGLEILCAIVPEVDSLVKGGNRLSQLEQGELVGQMIGRYGTDFLLFAGTTKALKYCRDLRRANTLLAIEKSAKSLNKRKYFESIWKERTALAKQIRKSKGDVGKELFRAFRNDHLTEREVRVLLHNAGMKTFSRPKNIPQNWKVALSQKKGGMLYMKDEFNSVRVMRGDKKARYLSQRTPYVKQMKNGKYLDKNGVVVPKSSAEAHIPIKEFKFHK